MNLNEISGKYLSRKFRNAITAGAIVMAPLAAVAQQSQTAADTTATVTAVQVLAPPPETEAQAAPHRATPLQSFAPLFTTDDEKERNIFIAVTRGTVREFRTLMNTPDVTGPLTKAEQKYLNDIRAAAKGDVKKYKIPASVAATLRFVADRTGSDFDAMVERLQENSGNVMNVNPAKLRAGDVYKFNVSTWLYLVKEHGAKYGLGFFADKIEVGAPAADAKGEMTVRVSVDDPAVLRQLVAMRANPRISSLLGAEYVAHEAEIPQTAYKGMNYVYDVKVAEEQRALMTIGFDLGIRGADGIRGPLTVAAKKEFKLMSTPLLAQGQTVEQMLQQAAQQAVEDAARFSAVYGNITPATAFAVRHAATVAGVDFGYLMQLARAESHFDAEISASTSSATGLFQFIDNTWLISLYKHGEKYGLGDIASRIDVETNKAGVITTASIKDPLVEKYALGLRSDPRVMALMGAEFAKENRQELQAALPSRDITRTDQYLAHFLGSGQAVTFIAKMDRAPQSSAPSLFPAAASANHNVFYKRGGVARSLQEVYNLFKAKFNSTFFDDPAPPVTSPVPLPRPRPSTP